jgi:hypothetical protein
LCETKKAGLSQIAGNPEFFGTNNYQDTRGRFACAVEAETNETAEALLIYSIASTKP